MGNEPHVWTIALMLG